MSLVSLAVEAAKTGNRPIGPDLTQLVRREQRE
jgi:hypothetical protein